MHDGVPTRNGRETKCGYVIRILGADVRGGSQTRVPRGRAYGNRWTFGYVALSDQGSRGIVYGNVYTIVQLRCNGTIPIYPEGNLVLVVADTRVGQFTANEVRCMQRHCSYPQGCSDNPFKG